MEHAPCLHRCTLYRAITDWRLSERSRGVLSPVLICATGRRSYFSVRLTNRLRRSLLAPKIWVIGTKEPLF